MSNQDPPSSAYPKLTIPPTKKVAIAGAIGTATVVGAATAPAVITAGVGAIGFTSAGVAAGSIAAGAQGSSLIHSLTQLTTQVPQSQLAQPSQLLSQSEPPARSRTLERGGQFSRRGEWLSSLLSEREC